MRHKWGPVVPVKFREGPHYQRELYKKSVCATCGITKVVHFFEYQYYRTYWVINDEVYISKRTPECQMIPSQLTMALK